MSPGGPHARELPRGTVVGSAARRAGRRLLCLLCLLSLAGSGARTPAYTITLAPATPKTIYLRIGVGSFTGTYCGTPCTYIQPIVQSPGSAPGNNTTINKVSVSVAANAVGNGVTQAMTTDSAQATSSFDNFAFCNAPTQLYIGGFYRTTGPGTGSVSVTATVPAVLTDAGGDTLSFAQISWTSAGNGDAGAEPFPAGTFTPGGMQTVGTIQQNQWAESCWTFSYKNSTVPPAGTYTGRVLYTLTAP